MSKTYTLPAGVGDRVEALNEGKFCEGVIHGVELDAGSEWLYTVYFIDKLTDKVYDYARYWKSDFGKYIFLYGEAPEKKGGKK